jgi:predicted enzyme related to lactoylglutathione lyase
LPRGTEKRSNLRMRIQWSGLTIDCADPGRLAAFWGALLGRDHEPGLPGWVQLKPRHDHEPRINFQPVPEAKHGKVRIHLDIAVDNLELVIRRVLALGGSETGQRYEYPAGTVVVLKDSEGNEFCLVEYR